MILAEDEAQASVCLRRVPSNIFTSLHALGKFTHKKNFPPKLYVSGPTKFESILDTQMKLSIKGKMK